MKKYIPILGVLLIPVCLNSKIPYLEFPVILESAVQYEDGGTTCITIQGLKGKKLEVYIDRRLSVHNTYKFETIWCHEAPEKTGSERIKRNSSELELILSYLYSACSNYRQSTVKNWDAIDQKILKDTINLIEPVAGGDATR